MIIAIVEDEQDISELVALHLGKAGYHTVEHCDPHSFLDSLTKTLPDLVILDLMLPDMDGLEICKLLKKDPKLAFIPVIMLTARAEETDKILGLELGADDYITKPFSPRELVARVRSVLRRSETKQQ
ncbi:MAG: response regulator, partial [Candidatus Margulisiibacteriota bacterium]